MSAKLNVYLMLLSLVVCVSNTRIKKSTIQVTHQLFDLTNNISRSTTVPFNLYTRLPLRSRPLIALLPGAFVLASDYERLSSAFAYRGFIVAVPQYDQRPFPASLTFRDILAHLRFTSTLTPPCPQNGQLPSAALISSLLTHVSQYSNSHHLLRKILVDRTVIFGHSAGGASALHLVSGQCAKINPLGLSSSSFGCERVVQLPPPARIVGLALFEGIPPFAPFRFQIPADMFVSVLESQFYNGNTEAILQPNGNLLEALISDANHFGPNDFTNATMIPRCALPRPREAMFRTNYLTQRTVISTIATIVSRSYRVFFKGHDKRILTKLPIVNPRVETLSIS
ncbi:unnamed protein product [Agarophyton chilense]